MTKKINRKGLDDVLDTTPDMNATARMVLMSYARTMQYVPEVQTTWQGQEAVAKFAGVSEDTLVDYTKALVKDGYLILVSEEKLGNNKVKRFYALGQGTLTEKLLKRRESNKGATNLVPGAKQKRAKDKPLGTTQEPPLGTTQNRPLGGTETNTKGFTKVNTVQPSAASVAVAPSVIPSSNKDKDVPRTSSISLEDDPSLISEEGTGALISPNTEEAASGSNPETWVSAHGLTLRQQMLKREEERKASQRVGASLSMDDW